MLALGRRGEEKTSYIQEGERLANWEINRDHHGSLGCFCSKSVGKVARATATWRLNGDGGLGSFSSSSRIQSELKHQKNVTSVRNRQTSNKPSTSKD